MVKINLEQIPERLIHAKELVSANQFKLNILAQKITNFEIVDSLIAKPTYDTKIDILEHQTKTALHVLNNFSHRALLADEVGLGKTIEAGIIIKEYIVRKLASKILILTPATLKYQWQEEMRSKFEEEFEIANTPEDYHNKKVIASIDTAKTPRHKKVLETIDWDLIIIDEAHKLKNSATLNYKLIKSLRKKRCLMLTATPLQNNIFELWTLLDLLHPGFLETKAKFTEKFVSDKDGMKIINDQELQQKLSKIMIRNLRKDVGIKFAKRSVKTHLLEYSSQEMKFYQEAINFIKKQYQDLTKLEKEIGQDDDIESVANLSEEELKKMASEYKRKGLLTFSLIMLTRQLTSSLQTGIKALERYQKTIDDPKKIRLIELLLKQGKNITDDRKKDHLLKLLKKEQKKVIIFTTFIHTQNMLEFELQKNNYSTVKFNGTMTAQEKEDAISEFKEKKQILICTDSGSEGRNLQFAQILINFDLPWNPMRIEQRIGRVHRIGQKHDVTIHNLAIKNTIESYILNKLYEKISLFTVAVGEMDLILSQLKQKGSIEQSIFNSYFNENEKLSEELSTAKETANNIKKFDQKIFKGEKHSGS
ncbi:DEAD/DEAH box helicase family protein [Candidatus Woesearchaeota archaeon]|nr:DEAD/DEAH box helicase family protein [Candidatus Woesearchaeota archaeon]